MPETIVADMQRIAFLYVYYVEVMKRKVTFKPSLNRKARQREQTAALWQAIELTGFVATEQAIANYQAAGPLYLLSIPEFRAKHPELTRLIAAYGRINEFDETRVVLERFRLDAQGQPRPARITRRIPRLKSGN